MPKDFKDIIIAVDFDGTCVTHEFPRVGRDIGAEPVLKELVKRGARLILWTMRGNLQCLDPINGMIVDSSHYVTPVSVLDDAKKWFKDRNIPLFGINNNPEQRSWTNSPKAYAHLYIDDAALGVPLIKGRNGERDYVDWIKVAEMLGL